MVFSYTTPLLDNAGDLKFQVKIFLIADLLTFSSPISSSFTAPLKLGPQSLIIWFSSAIYNSLKGNLELYQAFIPTLLNGGFIPRVFSSGRMLILGWRFLPAVWKASKYGVISGPYSPVYGPEITPFQYFF